MVKPKSSNFEIGDEVFHIVNEDRTPGIVIGSITRGPLGEYEVDWGPLVGSSIHYAYVLRDEFVPKFGEG